MALLAGLNYDPATAVTKTMAAATAMAAFDTTNARLSFTVPANGIVLVRIRSVIHGATTFSQFLFGVLEGSTVRGRQAPQAVIAGTAAATTLVPAEALFLVTGLTPGASLTWDAAWSCETYVVSSLLKYGGPNDTTANNAWAGLAFEVWDTA